VTDTRHLFDALTCAFASCSGSPGTVAPLLVRGGHGTPAAAPHRKPLRGSDLHVYRPLELARNLLSGQGQNRRSEGVSAGRFRGNTVRATLFPPEQSAAPDCHAGAGNPPPATTRRKPFRASDLHVYRLPELAGNLLPGRVQNRRSGPVSATRSRGNTGARTAFPDPVEEHP
jgi:hypothetical protein